jgi:uncharacterized protein
MRRKEREISDKKELLEILDSASVCRIALNDDVPYIVPLSYGYTWKDRLELYFHSATNGKKMELLKQDKRAGFEIDTGNSIVKSESPCDWGTKYRSIIGKGTIEWIDDPILMEQAMDRIMDHYGHQGKPSYGDGAFDKVRIFKLVASELAGKQRK